MNADEIKQQALAELATERTRELIDAEKQRIRSQTVWGRFIAWLPFTITINWRTK